MYETIGTIPICLGLIILSNLNTDEGAHHNKHRHNKRPRRFLLDGELVSGDLGKSLRLRTFMYKGTDCVSCGAKGAYFSVDRCPKEKRLKGQPKIYHMNLRTEDDKIMTVDHIIPRCKGGRNSIDNAQPMCSNCNQEKGNKILV